MKLLRLTLFVMTGCMVVSVLFWCLESHISETSKPAMFSANEIPGASLAGDHPGRLDDALSFTSAQKPSSGIDPKPIPDIALIGISIQSDQTCLAIISEKGIQRMVRIDDVIHGSWTLVRIAPKHIVLSNKVTDVTYQIGSGRRDVRNVDQDPAEDLQADMSDDHARKMERYFNGRLPEQVPFPMGMNVFGIVSINDNDFEVDLVTVLEEIRQVPLHKQAQYNVGRDGLEFLEIVPGSLIDRSGFVPGDIVIRINGEQVARFGADVHINTLFHPGKVDVELNRDSKDLHHTYLVSDHRTK